MTNPVDLDPESTDRRKDAADETLAGRDADGALGADERDRLEAAFGWLPDAYLETDEVGTVLYANGVAGRLLGRPTRDLVGEPLPVLVPTDARAALTETLRAVRRDGQPGELTLDVATTDGRHLAVKAHVSAGTRASGRLRWLLRDVTAEREGVRAYLDAVLTHIPLGVAMTDANARIVTANPAARAIFGRDAVTAGGTPFVDVPAYGGDGSSYEPGDRPIERSLRDGEIVVGERVELDAGGTRRSLEVTTAPIRETGGGISGGVIVFRDVTDAERRDRAVQEFVVNAAHEMRTPVASIAAALDVLEAGAKDEPGERERFLGHLRGATDRLTALTHALLLLARIESGREAAPVDVVPLEDLLAELAAETRTGPAVTLEVACPEGLAALTSASLLRQAVAAVLDNAVRFTASGSIRLSAEPLDADLVSVAVSDTGPGMDPATLEAATTRFFHGADGRGFGVGLSIAARAAEAAGGTIALDSKLGAGTTVTITVPSGRILAP